MNGSEPPSSSTCFLMRAAGRAGDPRTDLAGAGQRHRRDALVGDQPLGLRAGDQHRAEQAVGEAGVAQDLLDGQRADCGTFDACFSTIPLPAISAGAPKRKTCQNGKFHGMIARTVPSGS